LLTKEKGFGKKAIMTYSSNCLQICLQRGKAQKCQSRQ
jgi:hypothetical protein